MAGIAAGRQNDAGSSAIGPFNLELCQRLVLYRLHHRQKIGFQQRQYNLRLGVAEAAVILDDLRAIGREHQAKVQTAFEWAALFTHGCKRRKEDGVHADLRDFCGVIGVGGHGAHTAGIEAGVIVPGTFVIHGRDHGADGTAVGKCQHADLGTSEKFFDDNFLAGLAKGLVLHDGFHRILRLVQVLRDQNALAERQTVCLEHNREAGGLQVRKRRVRVAEHLVSCGGDTVFFHQVLGKDLAGFDTRGLGVWAEAGDSGLVQPVHAPKRKRIVRRDNGKVNVM